MTSSHPSLSAAEPVEGSPRERGVRAAVWDQQVVEDAVLINSICIEAYLFQVKSITIFTHMNHKIFDDNLRN